MKKYNESFYNFTKLSINEKMSVIHHADFSELMSRNFMKYNIKLCYSQIGEFFVEIWFEMESNKVFNIFPFTTSGCLKPYFNQIDISDLYL